MRHIIKQQQPEWYKEFKRGKTNNHWDSFTKRYQNEKDRLKQELLAEQHYLCGYCGAEIGMRNSHIDHVIPRSLLKGNVFPTITAYSYQNMLISCQARSHPEGDDTCGHAKEDWYDRNLFVVPHDSDCESYFSYTNAGEMVPTSQEEHSLEYRKAVTTIEKLRLNTYALKTAREGMIAVVLGDDLDVPMSVEEIERLQQAYQTPDQQGRLQPYCFAVLHVLEAQLASLRK